MNLDALEESVLSQARSERTLSGAARVAQLGAIEARWSAGDVPAFGELDAVLGVTDVATSTSWLAKLAGLSPWQTLAVGLVVGAAGGFAGGAAFTSTPGPHAVAAPVSQQAPVQAESPLQQLEEEAPVNSTVSTVPNAPVPETQNSLPNDKPIAHSEKQPATKEQEKKLSFYEELSFLKRAQKALRSGQTAMALGLMKGLDESHPEGALLVERRVTQVLALCELGRIEEAAVLSEQITQSSAGAAYQERLRDSCVGAKSPDESNAGVEMDLQPPQHQ